MYLMLNTRENNPNIFKIYNIDQMTTKCQSFKE